MQGILFKDDLILKVGIKEKNQTRRVIKGFNYGTHTLIGKGITGYTTFWDANQLCVGVYPRYAKDEILYIKENYYLDVKHDVFKPSEIVAPTVIEYVKDPHESYRSYTVKGSGNFAKFVRGKFRNKLFMPESFARYFIQVSRVRVERLQHITMQDCVAEGFRTHPNPQIGFKEKWIAINGKESWAVDPYVFVYDFELIEI